MRFLYLSLFTIALLCLFFFCQAQPSFIQQLSPRFDYKKAYILINERPSSYDDLLQQNDTSVLRIELYRKKEAIKKFGKDNGQNGVISYTSRLYHKPDYDVTVVNDSVSYYTKGSDTIYTMLPKAPTLLGDTTPKSWLLFIQRNLNRSVPAFYGSPEGLYRVTARFVVNDAGSVTDVTIQDDPGYGTGEEAIRVLQNSPHWQPVIYKGRLVKSAMKQSFLFVVTAEK